MKITIAARLLLSACCCLSAALALAAIITERNDVYDGASCYTTPAYTFIGTSSRPGIDSCWIPYGTYTDGVGGTEYTRVTSNLMGVVASALGGLSEREKSIFGDSYTYMLRPLGIPDGWYLYDHGEFWESVTNRSLRIGDQLNRGIMRRTAPFSVDHIVFYRVMEDCLEPRLGEVAKQYGSRRLDDLTGNVEPPISSEWSTKIPWSASDVDVWRNVYPRYCLCTNDIHFLPDAEHYWWDRMMPCPFGMGGFEDIWGHDAYDAYTELYNACTNPLPITIEDVLSADTGWKDDDYTHWRNGTTRLDWKRLGIICQLERQMETTYKSFSGTDELPYYNISADHSILYRSDVAVPLPIPARNGQTETVRGVFSNAIWVEDKDQEVYHSKTNDLGWCRPTCRVPTPSSVPGAILEPKGGYTVQIDDAKLEEVIADLCAQWTNNLVFAIFSGDWLPLEGNGLGLRYTANFMEGRVNVVYPSNTVAASTSDGFHYFDWRETPIAQDEWRSEDGFYFDIHDSANGGCVNLSYSNSTNDWSIGYYNEGFDLFNGDIVIPQVTFTAIESEGNPSNWIWQVSGIDGLASNTASSISWGDDNTKRWHWYWNGTDDVAAMIEAAYIGDPTFQYVLFEIHQRGGFGMRYGGSLSSGPFPRVYTTKTLNASWTTSSYTKEELVDSYFPLSYYAVSVDPLTETNGTFGVMASLSKHSSAAFTFATAERRDETIARFSGPYYRSYDWDRIKTLRRSELDLLLSCSGSHSMADSTDPWDEFSWRKLLQWSGSGRLFRFVSGTDAYNRQSAENARYNVLADLSAKCKSKCTELGGMPIVSMETYGKIAEKEKAALKNDLKSARVEARFLLTGLDDFYIEAAVHWDENKSGYVVDQILYPTDPPHTIGDYGWSMIVDCDFSSTSNQYRSARADVHQAPVEKTLWKFKNLRDPNL